jgi:fucose 4-O-acetylase-like acetyltransferase
MNRLNYIDQLRALAIFMIIFEHNDHSSWLSAFSTSFSVPLFFIISGFVSRDKESICLWEYLKKQFNRLIVPYFSISILLFIFWFFVGRHYGESAEHAYDPIKNLIGIVYAQGGPEYMNWGIPMWFLPALFVVGLIDFFVSKMPFKLRFIPLLGLPVLGYVLFEQTGFHFPWSIDVAMAVYGFYFLGGLIRRFQVVDRMTSQKALFAITIFFLIIHTIGANYNGRVLYYYSDYGHYFPMMYLNGITGFIWVFSLFKLLPTFKPITWVGRNTLPLLGFHLLAMTFIKGFALFVLGIEIDFNVWLSLIFAVLQIALVVPLILILNRYLPFMVGNLGKKGSA